MVGFKQVVIPELYRVPQIRVTEMNVHAYGLMHPGHMEFMKDGRLLVSEFARGRVTDITSGGDFRDAKPFISGLTYPASIIADVDGEVLVVDTGADAVLSFSESTGTQSASFNYRGAPAPYGAVRFRDKLLATYTSYQDNGLIEVHDGETSFLTNNRHVYGFPVGVSEYPYVLAGSAACGHWAAGVADDKLILAQTTFGILWDVTNPGKFDTDLHKRFAWGLDKPVGMIYNEALELMFVAESGSGSVKAIPKDGGMDMRYVPAIVTGLHGPRCIRFHPSEPEMFVCDMSACCVWRISYELR